jgi:hypothetical protein
MEPVKCLYVPKISVQLVQPKEGVENHHHNTTMSLVRILRKHDPFTFLRFTFLISPVKSTRIATPLLSNFENNNKIAASNFIKLTVLGKRNTSSSVRKHFSGQDQVRFNDSNSIKLTVLCQQNTSSSERKHFSGPIEFDGLHHDARNSKWIDRVSEPNTKSPVRVPFSIELDGMPARCSKWIERVSLSKQLR